MTITATFDPAAVAAAAELFTSLGVTKVTLTSIASGLTLSGSGDELASTVVVDMPATFEGGTPAAAQIAASRVADLAGQVTFDGSRVLTASDSIRLLSPGRSKPPVVGRGELLLTVPAAAVRWMADGSDPDAQVPGGDITVVDQSGVASMTPVAVRAVQTLTPLTTSKLWFATQVWRSVAALDADVAVFDDGTLEVTSSQLTVTVVPVQDQNWAPPTVAVRPGVRWSGSLDMTAVVSDQAGVDADTPGLISAAAAVTVAGVDVEQFVALCGRDGVSAEIADSMVTLAADFDGFRAVTMLAPACRTRLL